MRRGRNLHPHLHCKDVNDSTGCCPSHRSSALSTPSTAAASPSKSNLLMAGVAANTTAATIAAPAATIAFISRIFTQKTWSTALPGRSRSRACRTVRIPNSVPLHPQLAHSHSFPSASLAMATARASTRSCVFDRGCRTSSLFKPVSSCRWVLDDDRRSGCQYWACR